MLIKILLVGLGGGIGSILRFLTSTYISQRNAITFPIGTFMVNILGCLLIGFLLGAASRFLNEDVKLLLITGLCGGYTTFSTFSSENLYLLENGNFFILGIYVVASIILGLLAVWLGTYLAEVTTR